MCYGETQTAPRPRTAPGPVLPGLGAGRADLGGHERVIPLPPLCIQLPRPSAPRESSLFSHPTSQEHTSRQESEAPKYFCVTSSLGISNVLKRISEMLPNSLQIHNGRKGGKVGRGQWPRPVSPSLMRYGALGRVKEKLPVCDV